jgi:hypothetical protein
MMDDDDDNDDDPTSTTTANNCNSIQFFIYLRADSTAIGLLQSQHGHIQQEQWTAQRQCTKTTYKNKNNNKNKWPVQARVIIIIIIQLNVFIKVLDNSRKANYR